MKKIFFIFLFFDFIFPQSFEQTEIKGTTTFVSSSLIYLSFGRGDSILIGDTVEVIKNGENIANLKIIAIAKNSSAAEIINSTKQITIGDSVSIFKFFKKEIVTPEIEKKILFDITLQTLKQPIIQKSKMITSGRVSLQYVGSWTQGANINFNQPAVLTRLNFENFLESDLRLSLYARTFYNLHKTENQNSTTRVYDFMFENVNENNKIFYSLGRQTSRYVGGLGITDGFQSIYNFNDYKFGILIGAEPHHTTFGVDGDDKKGAVFINYNKKFDDENRFDGTFAFASKYYEGKVDREFIYFQNSFLNSSNLSFYQSAEFDLNDMNYGVRKKVLKLSNIFLSSTYNPVKWLTLYGGFDASRSVYHLESMKSFSDTLLDKDLLYGIRLSTTFRFPKSLMLTLNGSIRTKSLSKNNNSMYSAMFRANDILKSGVSLNSRVSTNEGIYSKGNNLTFELDRNFLESLLTSLRYDFYNYKILTTNKNYSTHTFTSSINWRYSKNIYAVTSIDYVLELNMRTIRYFGEIGVRF